MSKELGVVIRFKDGSIVNVMHEGSCDDCDLNDTNDCSNTALKGFPCLSLERTFSISGVYLKRVE